MLQAMYAIFRFLFEILCLAIAGYWGFSVTKLGNWRYALGILAAFSIVLVWGIWGAPGSEHRLQGFIRLIFELGIYTAVSLFLYHTSLRNLTIGFSIIAIVNASINYFTGWLI